MNPRELVDHIRSGPTKLVLDEPLRFRRRTRFNPWDFNEFLQALRSSETIRKVTCCSQLQLGISEDEWVLLVMTLGSIKGIKALNLHRVYSSRNFQAIAEAVNSAPSLCKLTITLEVGTFPRDPSGMIALANALREHTALQEFGWFCWNVQEAVQSAAPDPVLLALPACPQLRVVTIMTKCASADAVKNLLQLQSATELHLVLKTDQWLAVADEIGQGRCNVRRLTLSLLRGIVSEATEAVEAVASAIRLDSNLDSNLENLVLRMENGFTDEACVELAEALKVNKSLRKISLSTTSSEADHDVYFGCSKLGAQSYEAFAAMLRINTSLVLKLPPLDTIVFDERLFESWKQMCIEQRLNNVGRGRLLASRQTPREEWVDALQELSSDDDDNPCHNPSAVRVSCLYSLLRLNPSGFCLS
jgi:hypothetical protein